MRYMNILDPIYSYVSAKPKKQKQKNNKIGLNKEPAKGFIPIHFFVCCRIWHSIFPTVVYT